MRAAASARFCSGPTRGGALDAGFTRVQLTATIPAVPFYAAQGYEPAGKYDLPLPSGRILELRLMTKRLIPSR